MKRLAALAVLLASFAALAGPVSVWKGQTKTLKLSIAVSKALVDDNSVVDVSRSGRDVSLTGKESGKTTLHVKTVDGDSYDFVVYVTDHGTVYSTGRDEVR